MSFVTRVTGMMRAFLMLGALIPLNINSMSIFSFSATLCKAGDFIHPGYQVFRMLFFTLNERVLEI
jgi:hypothetical protein